VVLLAAIPQEVAAAVALMAWLEDQAVLREAPVVLVVPKREEEEEAPVAPVELVRV
jgi:hypothetical protein